MLQQKKMLNWLVIVMVISLAMFMALGCGGGGGGGDSNNQSDQGNNDDNSGNDNDNSGGDNAGNDCVSVISDDFSGALSDNWVSGTNSLKNESGPTVAIDSERVAFTQQYDYIESLAAVSGDFDLSMEVMRESGSNQCADYFIELVALNGLGATMRFSYGMQRRESINIGAPPVTDQSNAWDCIHDGDYLQEIDSDGESKGTLVFTYQDGAIELAFTNDEGATISTLGVPVDAFSSTKIRIWAVGGEGSPRYIDNIELCALSADDGASNDGSGDNSGDSGSGSGDCSNSSITLTIDGETETLSLIGFNGFESDLDGNLYSCAWNTDPSEDQIAISGIPADLMDGTTLVMSDNDPSHLSLIWNNDAYFPTDFSMTFDTWDGPGGNANGTLSGAFYNLPLDRTITLTDVSFCAPIVE